MDRKRKFENTKQKVEIKKNKNVLVTKRKRNVSLLSSKNVLNTTKLLKHEIGGYYNVNSKTFVKTANTEIGKNGRMFVRLPTGEHSILWHTHPKGQGFWPSREDIYQSLNNPYRVFMIVTPLGMWLYDAQQNMHFTRTQIFNIDHAWKLLNKQLMKLTQKERWTIHEIDPIIDSFTESLKQNGFFIQFYTFIPTEISKNNYIQLMNTKIKNRLIQISKMF